MKIGELLENVQDWAEDDLLNLNSQIVAMIKHKRDMRTMLKRTTFAVGDKVEWVNTRKRDKDYNKTLTGVITRMNPKKCVVKQDDSYTRWNMPYNMITKREQEGSNFNPITGDFE